MSGPSGSNILGAVFLIIGGLFLILIGGVCTVGLGAALVGDPSSFGPALAFLLASVAILGAGVVLIVLAVKLLRER